MLFVSVLLLFAQGEDYSKKSLKLMLYASIHQKSNSPYYKNPQTIIVLRSNCMELAKKICFDPKEIKKHSTSDSIKDKIAAAYAYGLGTISSIDDNLLQLMLDDDNMVSIAARESMIFIANKKLTNFVVDCGPSPHATKTEKYLASCVWKKFMALNKLYHGECSPEEIDAFRGLCNQLDIEESKKYFRKKLNTQLENVDYHTPKNRFFQTDKELEEKITNDLLDPSSYSVKADTIFFIQGIYKRLIRAF
jgi:hypothetical protein